MEFDAAAYFAWIDREAPSMEARLAVGPFLSSLADRPYAYPSVPLPESSEQPLFEVREAALPVPGEPDVWIHYRHVYVTGEVTILDIRAAKS